MIQIEFKASGKSKQRGMCGAKLPSPPYGPLLSPPCGSYFNIYIRDQ
jgi:hypothetical protein